MTDAARDAATTGLELSLQEVIYAGLDALRAARPDIDLAAYLHAAGDNGPQLFLASPTLASMKPNEAFELFGALRDALSQRDAAHEDEPTGIVAGFHAVIVVTGGNASRGLHAVGRRDEALTADDGAALARLAHTLGTVNHRIEEAARNLAT